MRWALIAVPTAGSLVLTACGEDGKAQGETVEMVEMRYEPADLTIRSGTTVTWTNESDFVHTVTTNSALLQDGSLVSSPAGEEFDSGNIAPGASWSHTFATPGEYRYACIPHELAGMVARLVVDA